MPILPLRAQQSTSTTGTGTVALNAAPTGRRDFQDAYGTGSIRIRYVISGTSFYEIGYGDFDGGSPGTLTRDTVISSSNADGLVSLPSGTADVFTVIDPGQRGAVTGTGDITLALADLGNTVVFTGTVAHSCNLPPYADVPPGEGWLVRNAGTAGLTIDPNASETVDGATTLVLPPGASAEVLRVGSGWAGFRGGASGRLLNIQVFTSGIHTYQATPGTGRVEVEVQGAGGGSGGLPATSGSQNAIAGPAGSGAYARGVFTSDFDGVTVTAGAAGAAGTSTPGNGGNGGASSFGTLLSCPGGKGSTKGTASSVFPFYALLVDPTAAPSGTSIIAAPGAGSVQTAALDMDTGMGIADVTPSFFGSGPGAGAPGNGSSASTSHQVGIAGQPGIVIVKEYAL